MREAKARKVFAKAVLDFAMPNALKRGTAVSGKPILNFFNGVARELTVENFSFHLHVSQVQESEIKVWQFNGPEKTLVLHAQWRNEIVPESIIVFGAGEEWQKELRSAMRLFKTTA